MIYERPHSDANLLVLLALRRTLKLKIQNSGGSPAVIKPLEGK